MSVFSNRVQLSLILLSLVVSFGSLQLTQRISVYSSTTQMNRASHHAASGGFLNTVFPITIEQANEAVDEPVSEQPIRPVDSK